MANKWLFLKTASVLFIITISFTYAIDTLWTKTYSLGEYLNVQWQNTYGNTGGECAYCIQCDEDRGYIMTGYTSSYGGGVDIYLIKTDLLGDTVWTKIYGGTYDDIGYDIKQTGDNGYIITGATNYYWEHKDVILIKADSLGNIIWQRIYGGESNDIGRSIQCTSDEGYIVTGYTRSGWDNVWLLKLGSEAGISEFLPIVNLRSSVFLIPQNHNLHHWFC